MEWDELIASLMAAGDEGRKYLARYTLEFVRESLNELSTMLGLYLGSMEDEPSVPMLLAGKRVAVYMDLLWRRLRDWSTVECDYLAWRPPKH
jgi:hypothetical protein